MAPEPTIGGLTAEQLVDKAAGQAFAQAMATASLNARQVSASERSLFKLATVMGATEMYRTLVALGKDLLDPAPPRPIADAWQAGCRCLWRAQGPLPDGATESKLVLDEIHPACPLHACTCPDIEVRTLGQEPGTGDTVKGLAQDCPIHGRG